MPSSELDQFTMLDENLDRFPTLDKEEGIQDVIPQQAVIGQYTSITSGSVKLPQRVVRIPKNHMILSPVLVNLQVAFGKNDILLIGTTKNPRSVGQHNLDTVGAFNLAFTGSQQINVLRIFDEDIDIYVSIRFSSDEITGGRGWVFFQYINMGLVNGYRRI